MAQNHERVPENLRKQFAVAVRSIKWSYAIFWSLSTTQQGVLEWGEGYYNGDIKTRKTVEGMEIKTDKMGLQRNVQLRELYKSLLDGETEAEQQAKAPSAALSPEDLTDAEWYYLLCMSFVFNPGEGLPGRALATGQTIWLCNAQHADSKVFSRSLLAKSASVQTVVCFPYLGGVVELGVTELVMEDLNLIQHIKASLLDFSKPDCCEKSSSAPHKADDDSEQIVAKVDHDVVDTLDLENLYSPSEEIKFHHRGINDLHGNHEEVNMDSPYGCSNGCDHNHQTEDSMMLEGTNAASQVQSWHFMDEDFSVQDSMNSSDCISEAFVNQGKAHSSAKCENANHVNVKELQNFNDTKLSSLDLGSVDEHVHYKRTLSALLASSTKLIENPCFCDGDCKSSFMKWKKGVVGGCRPTVHQKILKKILFTVPLMSGVRSPRATGKENTGKNVLPNLQGDDIHREHDKMRESEKLFVLRSMVPSITEVDKASILDDTIKYLKELGARAEEMESSMDTVEAIARMKFLNRVEKTSINYDKTKMDNVKRSLLNKRKACDIDETDPYLNRLVPGESLPLDVKVCVKEQEVVIGMRCPYREYILLDIMDAINNLYLDAHSVQSSTLDGVLTLNLKSKFRGAAISPVGMIKQALWKIAGKC
ncbi:transcription factor EGL1-like [Pyrus x bretschneideri]|uniref:transcription factor EGL1-like n=1 Tax=Pyrus x bretschneideri TaxID=225117 RepID=UPI0005115806|nr:transcription factor EGL1-like [Pyrus x bretschneideri]